MRAQRAFAAAALALLTLLAPRLAAAQRVLLVVPQAPDELLSEAFNRLRAELKLQGFETSLVTLSSESSSPDELTALAQKEGAFAGISLTRRVGAPAANICIADRVTGKVSLRTLALESDPDAPNVLAVRAADLLRSSLREFAQDQRPPPEVVGVDRGTAPELVRRWASTPRPRFHLDARVAALGLAEGIGAGFGPSLAFRYEAFDRLAVGAVVVGPALGAARETELGTASIRQELALARISWAIIASSAFELSPLLGAGVYHLDARGEVNAPLVGRAAQVTSFAGAVGIDAELRLVGALSLGAEASALTLSPRPGVAVREERYLFAWPFVTASVGIGVAF